MSSKKSSQINILAVESSCDETAGAILTGSLKTSTSQFKMVSSVKKSQITTHRKTGGIVPEVAARQHMQDIMPVIQQTLKNAKMKLSDVDYFAITTGPGLVVSLIVGTEFIKGLSYALNKPIIPTNHMAGHMYSAFGINPDKVKFPVLSVIVSGGHTMLVVMKSFYDYKVIGETVDDAAGEAFDKVARILGLPYPGGPEISKLAKNGKTDISFPRPMIKEPNFNFSFSGLKTAVLYYTDKLPPKFTPQQKADIAMSFENAVVDVITIKAIKAAQKYVCQTITLSGGVSANAKLRKTLKEKAAHNDIQFIAPSSELCTDNAQMIAIAAYFKLRNNYQPVNPKSVQVNPHWNI